MTAPYQDRLSEILEQHGLAIATDGKQGLSKMATIVAVNTLNAEMIGEDESGEFHWGRKNISRESGNQLRTDLRRRFGIEQ